jgi:hypothetical protein
LRKQQKDIVGKGEEGMLRQMIVLLLLLCLEPERVIDATPPRVTLSNFLNIFARPFQNRFNRYDFCIDFLTSVSPNSLAY